MKLDEAIDVLKDFAKQVKVKSDGAYQTDKGMCACMLAINALEKQIVKKPIIKQSKYCNAYHCPVCNGYIRSTNTRIEVILEENIFCGVCGQKLDWSDEE